MGRNGRHLESFRDMKLQVSICSNTSYGTVLIAWRKDQGLPGVAHGSALGNSLKCKLLTQSGTDTESEQRPGSGAWSSRELLVRDCQNRVVLLLDILSFTPEQQMEVHQCSSARGCSSSRDIVRSSTLVKENTYSVVELQFLLEGGVEGALSSITFPLLCLLVYW